MPKLTKFLSLVLFLACQNSEPKFSYEIITVHQDSEQTAAAAEKIFASSDIETAEGLEVSLWATDSLAPDPVAMSIDDFGRVYVTRTNRQKNSEFDIRGYRQWMTPSISLQSVEDRRQFLRETFAPEKSDENSWFPDLNKDSIHDWRDLMVEKEEVWRLEDTDMDGIADKSTRIVEDFHEEITDVAGALLVRRQDIFIGVGPDMWRLRDTDGDDIPDHKESISHGYAVHIGFGAHGMSGVIEGPDGKIYWGIGDIGANVTTKEGAVHRYPNQGVIVRCNADGSDFEVFAHGLRNTHEFVFDAYGNLISADNDGDHPGESERLVHIVEGSDAGWRANWQYGKYTDPKNNTYKVWMDEKLYVPRWEGQAAYIIPPIQNFHNGPTGMVYNPGTALGEDWLNTFFLVEFVGNPTRSPIWAFKLKSKGASFQLEEEQIALKGVLPTGLRFGPDGALYAADWVNGWGTKNYGRIWKIDVPEKMNNLADLRSETRKLMALDYGAQSLEDLDKYLGYQDLRIRQKAQFELARRGADGEAVLQASLGNSKNQLKRIHAIWGLGQMVAMQLTHATPLLAVLEDQDPEIVAQAAKVLGDVYAQDASAPLVPLLGSQHPRVQFFAAQALGRLKYKGAVEGLLDLILRNNDEDLYLRHAATLALARIGNAEEVIALSHHENLAMRTAAVLVLRHLQHPSLAAFLQDESEFIVTEAARAIHDDWSVEAALPALADLLNETSFTSEPLIRRCLSASQRLGGAEQLDAVIQYVQKDNIPKPLQAEALAVIGTWSNPSVLDRVDGRFRGEKSRNTQMVISRIKPLLGKFLDGGEAEIVVAATQLLNQLQIEDSNDRLAEIYRSHPSGKVRSTILTTLAALNYDGLVNLIEKGMGDSDQEVRGTALGMLDKLNVDKEDLPNIVSPILELGSIGEQQQLVNVLGTMPLEKTESIFEDVLLRWEMGTIAPEVKLDIVEAIDSSASTALKEKLDGLRSKSTLMDEYAETLYGGSLREGWRIFNQHATAQCTRCHSLEEGEHELATVGPPLRNIGNILSRQQLLESVIEPSARISPGYGVVMLTLNDDAVLTGTLLEEKENELVIKASNPEPIRVQKERIVERQNLPSSMPRLASFLSKREIRDLIEFLANMKDEEL